MEDGARLEQNRVIAEDGTKVSFAETQVIFKGKNNILYLEKGVSLQNSRIVFEGDQSVVYLGSSCHNYFLNLTLYHQSAFYMGKNNYMNGKLNAILSERKHILIGDRCLFSFGIWMRLADPHLIYDCGTKRRLNPSRSIFVGDHVWLGQNAMFLKGTQIGSGSIVGAMSVVAGKKIPSNTSWAGNPARQVGKRVFFTSACVHGFSQEATKQSNTYVGDEYVYQWKKGKSIDFDELDSDLSLCCGAQERLEYLRRRVSCEKEKNRFAVR